MRTGRGARTHPRGYVQRREGLKEPNEKLARHRAAVARHEAARFDRETQEVIHQVVWEIARERGVSLHGCASTPTHAHVLVSFRSPARTCGALNHCVKGCKARSVADTGARGGAGGNLPEVRLIARAKRRSPGSTSGAPVCYLDTALRVISTCRPRRRRHPPGPCLP
jgi:hypothetical protein